jgi:hypothetical protein
MLGCFCIPLLFMGCQVSQKLVIADQDSSFIYAQFPVTQGERFSIAFIHSVNQSPVIDLFAVEGRTIRPVEARYYTLGAGMPTSPEPGQTMRQEGDALIITGFTAAYESLNYIVGTVSDHILTVDGQEISLRGLCGRNAAVRIFVK